MNRRKLALSGCLLLLAIVWLVVNARFGSVASREISEKAQDSSKELVVSIPKSIVRGAHERIISAPSSRKELGELDLHWSGIDRLKGNLSSIDGNGPIRVEGVGDGQGVLQLRVPAGKYFLQLSDGMIASPSEFRIGERRVVVSCVKGSSGFFEVVDGSIPVGGVSILSRIGGKGTWNRLGETDSAGRLPFAGLDRVGELVFFKEREYLVLSSVVGGLREGVSGNHYDLAGQKEFVLSVIDTNTHFGISQAELLIGGVKITSADSEGRMKFLGRGSLQYRMEVQAGGYFAETKFFPDNNHENKYEVRLREMSEDGIRVLSNPGMEKIQNCRILIFSPRAAKGVKLVWKGSTDEAGVFHYPRFLDQHCRVVAWDYDAGVRHIELGVARQMGEFELERAPELGIRIDNTFVADSIVDCTAKTFWGDTYVCSIQDGIDATVRNPLGVSELHIVFSSGAHAFARRTKLYRSTESFLTDGLEDAVAGTLLAPCTETSVVTGVIVENERAYGASDLLQISFIPRDVGFENFKSWPSLGGARPSSLSGWQWKGQSFALSSLVEPDLSFRVQGVPNGESHLRLINLSRNSSAVEILTPEAIVAPKNSSLNVVVQEKITFDLIVEPKSGGKNLVLPILEYAESDAFGVQFSNSIEFLDNKVRCSLPISDTRRLRIVAPGFLPEEIIYQPDEDGVDRRIIYLTRELPMRIALDDKRKVVSPVSLTASFGRYNAKGGFMAPMGESTLEFPDNQFAEFYGAFPECDVFIYLFPGTMGKISPNRFLFRPGAILTIQLND